MAYKYKFMYIKPKMLLPYFFYSKDLETTAEI